MVGTPKFTFSTNCATRCQRGVLGSTDEESSPSPWSPREVSAESSCDMSRPMDAEVDESISANRRSVLGS